MKIKILEQEGTGNVDFDDDSSDDKGTQIVPVVGAKPVIFITGLDIKGDVGSITITEQKISATRPIKGTIKGSMLVIEGKSSVGNNSNVTIVGGSVYQSMFGSNISMSGPGYKMTNTSIELSGLDRNIVIDGVDVTSAIKEFLKLKRPGKHDNSVNEDKHFRLPDNHQMLFCLVSLSSNGRVRLPSQFVNTKKLLLTVAGSGDINVDSNCKIENLIVTVAGSGDISGDNAEVEHIVANVTGSGDITNFFVNKTARLNVVGSGDIKIRSSSNCRISKNIVGSGDIRVGR